MGKIPDRSEAELSQLARDLQAGRVFTDRHFPSSEERERMFASVFMIVGLGAFAGWTAEEVREIGLVYEYLDKAGPRSVNGYPSFFSLRLLNQGDTFRVLEKCRRIDEAVNAVLGDDP